MSTKTKSGLLPVLLVAGLVVAVMQTDLAQDVGEALGIVESSSGDIVVPPANRGRVKGCTPESKSRMYCTAKSGIETGQL
ncbi:MAG: hypothetical protein M3548_13795 [Actinomycetota bacterium]|nr:hypothetical protein [Actinomycetota bacterium]